MSSLLSTLYREPQHGSGPSKEERRDQASHRIFFAMLLISEWNWSLTLWPWPDTISRIASLSSEL